MRRRRLLSRDSEGGSATVDAVFGIVAMVVLALAVIEVALALYARNVVITAVHEGARAAVEVGSSFDRSDRIAAAAIEHSAGGLLHNVTVRSEVTRGRNEIVVHVYARGVLDPPGPFPWRASISSEASAAREIFDATR